MKKVLFGLMLLSAFTSQGQTGIVETICGNGTAGYIGNGVPATNSEVDYPHSVYVDNKGNCYVGDQNNNCIRMINSAGIITTIAGTAVAGYNGDDIAATSAQLNGSGSAKVDKHGNIIITDNYNNYVRKIDTNGIIHIICGNGGQGYFGDGGPATAAELYNPSDIAMDSSNNIYFSDLQNQCVRKIDAATGIVTTIAGNGTVGYYGDGGPASASLLSYPNYLYIDQDQNLYISDNGNHCIRMINSSGIISTVAGTGVGGYNGDGIAATSAKLYYPGGICKDKSGNLYIADYYNSRVRMVNTSGVISTIAGNGSLGFSGDGGPATAAEFARPVDVNVDSNSNIYIIDYDNQRIRKIESTTGVVNVIGSKDDIKIYPNPVTSIVNLESQKAIGKFQVYNTLGQEIIADEIKSNKYTLDLSKFNGGIYFIYVDGCVYKITKY